MAVEGVDYAGSRPDPAGLYRAGKRFVVRYGGPGGDWKHLTAAEAQALSAAGLMLVANAEGAATGLQGRQAGIDWARSADAAFRRLGMPATRPIYLSADWDVTSAQWPAVRDALRGAASVLGGARVGVYGSYNVMQWAKRDGVARWFWQTYAWSGGRWAAHNHIEQYRNNVSVAGGTVDLCRAKVADYGQWTLKEDDVSKQEVLDGLAEFFNAERTVQGAYLKNASNIVADFARGETRTETWFPGGVPGSESMPLEPNVRLASIEQTLADLAARPPATVDIEQLATSIVAKLPPTVLTSDEVKAAVKDALREGTGVV